MNIADIQGIHLGSGLIGIGRTWGYKKTPIPNGQEALDFLSSAVKQGIRYFDTAPAYGTSEERFGNFLKKLSEKQRSQLFIATKMGEHWNAEKNEAYVDHSYKALKKSIDQSLKRLGHIDLLYLHKTTIEALQDSDVTKAFSYAKKQGIKKFGASVSDLEAAEYVLWNDLYSIIQFPYNTENTLFSPIFEKATQKGKTVVINRPFNMGSTIGNKIEAFKFILEKQFNGFILTGTKSPKHLQENLKIFTEANQANI